MSNKERWHQNWLRYRSRRNKTRKIWYQKNRKRLLEYNRKYRKTFNTRFTCWKCSAKRRRLKFSITLPFLKSLPFVCAYTGRKLTFEQRQFNTVSLDRVDNNKGYTPKNAVLCCWGVNKMKSNFNKNLFVKVCREISKRLSN